MTTEVAFNPSSVNSFSHAAIMNANGTLFQSTITDVTWQTDATGTSAPGRYLVLGSDGTTDFNDGSYIAVYPNPSGALTSGQAIGWVGWVSSAPGNNGIWTAFLWSWIQIYLGSTNTGQTSILHQHAPGDNNIVNFRLAPPGRPDGADWRVDIGALHVRAWVAESYNRGLFGGTGPISTIQDLRLCYQRYDRPSISAITAPTASQTFTTTAKPTVAWTFVGDGLGPGGFQIKVFTAAQFGIGGFDPETSPNTYDSGIRVSTNPSFTIPVNLPQGSLRAYVKVFQVLPTSNYQHWSIDGITWLTQANNFRAFTIATTPPAAPVSMLPLPGGTVTTDLPTLGAEIAPLDATEALVKAEWQLARDSGFTTSLKTITQPDSAFAGDTSSNPNPTFVASMDVPAAQELFQGVWFMRARAIDTFGVAGAYGSTTTFTVTHVPTALTFTPTAGASLLYVGTTTTPVTGTWVFSDPSPTDSQTAYQVLVERDSDGLSIVDTGKVVSTAQSATVTIPSAQKDVMLRWRVRVYDSDDVVSAYSANQQFFVRDLPTVAVTAPPTGAWPSPTPTIAWTFSSSGGRTQAAFRVTVTDTAGSVLVYDSGWQTGSGLSYTIPDPVMVVTHTYLVRVYVRDSVGFEQSATQTATATWTPPTSPTFTVSATSTDTAGGTVLSWPQNRDPTFVDYRIWHQVIGEDPAPILSRSITDTAPSTYSVKDYSAPTNKNVTFWVTQRAIRFGTIIESALGTGIAVMTTTTHYWIVNPDNEALNVRLARVMSDTYAENWEQETIELLGRGRRVERGTRYGISGTLTATVYGAEDLGLDANAIRRNLLAMKAGSLAVYLRTPFGDVWRVVLSDIEIERIAGVGINAYFSTTIPYTEVVASE